MTRLTDFIILSLLMASAKTQPAEALAAFEAQTFITTDSFELPYRILWPEGYDREQAALYPLVLFLHGAGERGVDNRLQLTHGTPIFTNEQTRADYPAIVVMPQCPREDFWAQMRQREDGQSEYTFHETPNPSLAAASELLDYLMIKEKVDPDRVYLMGLSMGGMGTFELLARRPYTFAAAAPICGGTHPSLVPLYADRVPMWIFHGELDRVVPAERSRRIVKVLENRGIPVKYSEYEGIKHNSWDNAFAEPDLIPWLFSHRRQE